MMKAVYQDTPRRYPSRTAIVNFWKENGCVDHTNIRQCFKCGHVAEGYHHQRAHIIPRMYGGSDGAENIVILCAFCHKVQEFHLGDDSRTYEKVKADFYKWMGWDRIFKPAHKQ